MPALGVVLALGSDTSVVSEAPTTLLVWEHVFATLVALDYSIQVSRRTAIDKCFRQPASAPELLSKDDMSLLQTCSNMQKHLRDRGCSPLTPQASWRAFRLTGRFDRRRTDKGSKDKSKSYTQRFVPRKEEVDDCTPQ